MVATTDGDVETGDAAVEAGVDAPLDATVEAMLAGTVGALDWGAVPHEGIADAATRTTTSAAALIG